MLVRGKGKPDRVILDILANLNQEKGKHDIYGLYEGRLRSHAENFEVGVRYNSSRSFVTSISSVRLTHVDLSSLSQGLKRKWQGFTGVPVPKKLRTSEPIGNEHVEKEDENSKTEPSVKNEDVAVAMVDREQNQKHGEVIKATAIKAGTDNVPATATRAHLPPHPDNDVDIDSMTVNDLRKELRKRQLSTVGRKADLQARMRKHFAEERKLREDAWASKNTVSVKEAASTQTSLVKISDDSKKSDFHKKDVNEIDVIMEDVTESAVVSDVLDDLEQVATEPIAKKTDMTSSKARDPSLEREAMAKEVAQPKSFHPSTASKKQAPKSALKPSKYNPPIIESIPQLGEANPTAEQMPTSLSTGDPSSAAFSSKISDSSTDSINHSTVAATFKGTLLQSNVPQMTASSTLALKTPVGPALKTIKAGGSGSAMLLEKKRAHSAATEARKARLAEMRQKVRVVSICILCLGFVAFTNNLYIIFPQCGQPNAASSSFVAEPPLSNSKYAVSSTLKKMASTSTLGESKPNSILLKMREKAAAEKNVENAMIAPAKPPGTARHIGSTNPSSISTENKLSQVQTSSRPTTAQISTALKSILDPANKPTISEPIKQSPKKQEEKPLSPMQTYEMSDREEDSDSESESDGDENQRPKKTVCEYSNAMHFHSRSLVCLN